MLRDDYLDADVLWPSLSDSERFAMTAPRPGLQWSYHKAVWFLLSILGGLAGWALLALIVIEVKYR